MNKLSIDSELVAAPVEGELPLLFSLFSGIIIWPGSRAIPSGYRRFIVAMASILFTILKRSKFTGRPSHYNGEIMMLFLCLFILYNSMQSASFSSLSSMQSMIRRAARILNFRTKEGQKKDTGHSTAKSKTKMPVSRHLGI